MNSVEWIVWALGCFVLLTQFIVSISSREPFTRRMIGQYCVLAAAGLAATALTGLSKFHLLWWLPVTYFLNLTLTQAMLMRTMNRHMAQEMRRLGLSSEEFER